MHNFTQKSKLRDNKDEIFKYETIHTARKTRYASIKQDIFDKWIIVIPLSTYFIPYIKHNVNTTQSVGYIEFESENEALLWINKYDYAGINISIFDAKNNRWNSYIVGTDNRMNKIINDDNAADSVTEALDGIFIDGGSATIT